MRGNKLTMLMGSNTIKNIISKLDDDIEFINRKDFQNLRMRVIKKFQELIEKLLS